MLKKVSVDVPIYKFSIINIQSAINLCLVNLFFELLIAKGYIATVKCVNLPNTDENGI